MTPDGRFLSQTMAFWAHVRTLSQHLGYTERGTGTIRVHGLQDILRGLSDLGLGTSHLLAKGKTPTPLALALQSYFEYRAKVLNEYVRPRLMDMEAARTMFGKLQKELHPSCPLPLNKQKGEKKAPAFLTGIVNMLIERYSKGLPCDYDPHELTTFTNDGAPLRTLARRIDGAFPSAVNPIAVWEIKEYYYTTTFGSRVADGVYETLLDGMELEELLREERIKVLHYLIVDDRFTWWDCGRSYLCRIVDMLHMGYVDEVLFGREVVERLPLIVPTWVAKVRR